MKQSGTVRQFIKYVMVGVSNTLVSEGIYAVLIFFKMHYLPASFLGFSVSVVNAYYWNNKYVFTEQPEGEKRVRWKVFGKTYIAYFWGYAANAVMLVVWIDLIRISRFTEQAAVWFADRGMVRFDGVFLGNLAAAALNLLITVPLSYLLNKYWAFRQKDSLK